MALSRLTLVNPYLNLLIKIIPAKIGNRILIKIDKKGIYLNIKYVNFDFFAS